MLSPSQAACARVFFCFGFGFGFGFWQICHLIQPVTSLMYISTLRSVTDQIKSPIYSDSCAKTVYLWKLVSYYETCWLPCFALQNSVDILSALQIAISMDDQSVLVWGAHGYPKSVILRSTWATWESSFDFLIQGV